MGILGSGSIHMESRYARKPVSGRGASAATTVCQKCLQVGHWTYECKNAPAYQARPTRTKQLTDPKYRPRFLGAGELLPESRGTQAAAKDAKRKLKDKAKAKKSKGDGPSSSSSDSDSSSGSDSDSDSSSSDSDSSFSSGSSSSDGSSGLSSSASGSSSSDSDSDESSSRSKASDSSSSGAPAPPAKQKGGRASRDKAERKQVAGERGKPQKAAQAGGRADERGQAHQVRRHETGSNGAEATGARKRPAREEEGHGGARLDGGEVQGLQLGYTGNDRNGGTAGHAGVAPPRKKALRSVVVAAQ